MACLANNSPLTPSRNVYWMPLVLLVLPMVIASSSPSPENFAFLANGTGYRFPVTQPIMQPDPCSSLNLVPEGEALSLKALVRILNNLGPNEPIPDIISNFANISRISGFLFDPVAKDIILFGKSDHALPKMFFVDFVVALQNLNNVFAETSGNTISYSSPGCSIDPNPNVVAELNKLGEQFHSTENRGIKAISDAWISTCNSPQNVRVLGVPFGCHFSHVMVKADYDLKSIVDGTDTLPIKNFYSLIDRHLNQASSEVQKGNSISVSKSLNRFWFNPGRTAFGRSKDKNLAMFCMCEVKLSTEEQVLSHANTISGTGKGDVMADQFCSDFSASYELISSKRNIFFQLGNLYRLFAVAQALHQPDAPAYAKSLLQNIWKGISIPKGNLNKELPGRANIKGFIYTKTSRDRIEKLTLYIPACGGVDMTMKINSSNFFADKTGQLSRLSNSILNSPERRANSISWTYKLSA